MADERYDISITKEYLIRNKAKLLYISLRYLQRRLA